MGTWILLLRQNSVQVRETQVSGCRASGTRFNSSRANVFAAKNDQCYQSLIQAVADGKTDDNMQLGGYSAPVANMELVDDIGSDNQLVSIDGKLVIPETWVSQALDVVHSHHLGLVLTLQNARAIYWWP